MTLSEFGQQLMLTALTVVLLMGAAGCGEGVDTVEAGTYEGTVGEAVPAEKEIYVTLDNGKRLELYFTDQTELTQGGEAVDFGKLSKGTKVRVTVKRVGNRNEPTKVEIIE